LFGKIVWYTVELINYNCSSNTNGVCISSTWILED